MTTIAGSWDSAPTSGGDTPHRVPENRAADALQVAGGWTPMGNLAEYSELDKDMAAAQIANDITELAGLLTVRERIVLAGALLPEFTMPVGATDLQDYP